MICRWARSASSVSLRLGSVGGEAGRSARCTTAQVYGSGRCTQIAAVVAANVALTCDDAARAACVHRSCANEVCRGIVHTMAAQDPSAPPSRPPRRRRRRQPLAHPREPPRARPPAALAPARRPAPGRPVDRHRPRHRARHQLRRDELPPAQARVGRPRARHRGGRGQAAAVARRVGVPLVAPERLRGRRGLRDRPQLADPRLRPALQRAVRQVARRLDDVAHRLAGRVRVERRLGPRHRRVARRRCARRCGTSSSATAGSDRATRRPGASRSTPSPTPSTSTDPPTRGAR